jgi:hypothetical protein
LYSRILVGIIIGFAIDRYFILILLKFVVDSTFSYKSITLDLGELKVLLDAVLAIIIGSFFNIGYIRTFSNSRSFCVHLLERIIISFLLLGFLISSYRVGFNGLGTVVYHVQFFAIWIGVLLILSISFPITPVDYVLSLMSKNKLEREEKDKIIPTKKE